MKNGRSIILGLAVACAMAMAIRADAQGVIPPPSQKRITGTCSVGNAIRVVNADGSVTCQGAGGISNGAGNNVVMKSNGTNAVASQVTDDGTRLAIPTRLYQTTDFTGAATDHGAITSISQGVALTTFDGGVQSFQQSTFNTTAGGRQSIAIYAGNTASISSGGNPLNNYAVFASCSGGTNNYSFYSPSGYMQQDGGALFGVATANGLTVGAGSTAGTGAMQVNANFTINNANTASLGNNVQNFQVPGASGTNPTIALGYASAPLSQLATKNTDTGGSFGGLEVHLDSSVSASARGGLQLYRGAGGTAEVAGVNVAGGAGDFASGSTANDLIIHSYDPSSTGRAVLFATGSTPSARAKFTTGGDLQMPVTGQTGHVTDIGTAPTPSSCGTGPSASTGAWSFNVTTGTGATGCVLTFAKTFTNAPTCTVTSRSGTNAAYSISATAITLGSGTAASATYDIVCVGHT